MDEVLEMQVTHRRTEAERHREYRQRMGDNGRSRNAARMRTSRAQAIPEFIAVDSEGIGRGANHRDVLLGVGTEQYEADDMSRGLQWEEIFEFLYAQYRKHPQAAFVGFFLSYDFDNWLSVKSGLPQHAGRMLFTKAGQAARKMKGTRGRREYYPVREGGWEFDMMGDKRLSIRPRPEGCQCYENAQKCTHKKNEWMHICDAGSFFQMSFVEVIKPKNWIDDPDGKVCTDEEFKLVQKGKDRRDSARLDDEMRYYNRLENIIFAKVMDRLAKGFQKVGIRLPRDKWYGPGAAAQELLRQAGVPKRDQLRIKEGRRPPLMPKWFWDAAQATYYGGWFEIFSHGLILGESWNYDINNAYPFAQTKLPHICRDGRYKRGNGAYHGKGAYVLLLATVQSKGNRIGAMPNRAKDGGILRPAITRGWYWQFEIEAAKRAGIVHSVIGHKWVEFVPCAHDNPLAICDELYHRRLINKGGQIEKLQSAYGMALKLTNNSISGKCAQTVGTAPYNNWFYASFITAHCRTQILDAISTHPEKANAVLMVATDGVCFDSRHPSLPVSSKLGEWEETSYTDLCLFKPGVYWHRQGKDALLKVKSRGVPKKEFEKAIADVEPEFRKMLDDKVFPEMEIEEVWAKFPDASLEASLAIMKGWPKFFVTVGFRIKSPKQALNEGHWERSAQVQHGLKLRQDSDPWGKRRLPRYNPDKNRIDTVIHDLPMREIQTRYYLDPEIMMPPKKDYGTGFEGSAIDGILEAMATLRNKPANYDLEIGEEMGEWMNDAGDILWGFTSGKDGQWLQ